MLCKFGGCLGRVNNVRPTLTRWDGSTGEIANVHCQHFSCALLTFQEIRQMQEASWKTELCSSCLGTYFPGGKGSNRRGYQEQDVNESILGCVAKPRCCDLRSFVTQADWLYDVCMYAWAHMPQNRYVGHRVTCGVHSLFPSLTGFLGFKLRLPEPLPREAPHQHVVSILRQDLPLKLNAQVPLSWLVSGVLGSSWFHLPWTEMTGVRGHAWLLY